MSTATSDIEITVCKEPNGVCMAYVKSFRRDVILAVEVRQTYDEAVTAVKESLREFHRELGEFLKSGT